MNRLIILGNGFDLSHDLPTSFPHFILNYIKVAYSELVESGGFDSNLLQLRKNPKANSASVPETIQSLDDFINLKQSAALEVKSQNYILQHLLNNNLDLRWVDFEMSYYKLLTQVLTSDNLLDHDKRNLNSLGVRHVNRLNRALEDIKIQFLDFLDQNVIGQKMRKLNRQFVDLFNTHEFENNIHYKKSIILNFNYTDTIQQYLLAMSEIGTGHYVQSKIDLNRYPLINIHGSLHDPKNPIVFGFGDELDESYTQLENLNHNGLLQNAKSFGYFNTHNLDRLKHHTGTEKYDVYIIGHSCGLSDRTLLNEIFESDQCNQIFVFYHQNKGNYNEITYEISRHFRDKQLMRKKVLNFEYAGRCPQISDKDARNFEFPKFSLTEVQAINNKV